MAARRLAALAVLAAAVAAVASTPSPQTRGDVAAQPPPSYSLPPEELVSLRVAVAAAGENIDWSVVKVGAPAAWARGLTGRGVRVAVLDTGIDSQHADLKDAIDSAVDYTRSASGPADVNGHGTHCAGSIAARKNGLGLVGVAYESRVHAKKVLGDSGSGSVDGIARAITDAVAEGVDVVSLSLGGSAADSWIPPALARAEAAGVLVIAAAGNDGPREGTVGYPGGYKEAVAVAAVDASLKVASFSSRGPAVFVAGPGVNVNSTYPGNRQAVMSGTSMSTPNVAGVAALWVQANPQLAKKERPAAWRRWLRENAIDLAPAGRDTATGFGFVDAAKIAVADDPPTEPKPKTPLIFVEDLTPEARERLGLK